MGNVIEYPSEREVENEFERRRAEEIAKKNAKIAGARRTALHKMEGDRAKYPMIAAFAIRHVRNLISCFTGPYSYFPMLYLGMVEVEEIDVKFYQEHFPYYSTGVGSPLDTAKLLEGCPLTLSLFRWHCEMLMSAKILTSTPDRDHEYFSTITPYEIGSTCEDLTWYFRWKGETDWKGYDKNENISKFPARSLNRQFIQDASIMSVEHGYIPENKLYPCCENIVNPILGGRWDIADKYIRRGDMKNTTYGASERLSPKQLDILVSKYDVWKWLSGDVAPDRCNLDSLLRGGILPRNFLEENHSINLMAGHLSDILPSVPMNVVEDLFTVILFRMQKAQRRGRTNGVDLVGNIKAWFFRNLREEKRPTPPSSIHRMFKYQCIDLIIKTVRENEIDAERMVNSFIYSKNVEGLLRGKEEIPYRV